MTSHKWIEIDVIVETYDGESLRFGERVGRVYERKCFASQLSVLARARVRKHARVTPGQTYIAIVRGIGEIARAMEDV